MAYHKIAVVTGANRGIGAEVARQLSAMGHRVVGTYRNPDSVKGGGDIDIQQLDVRDDQSVSSLAGYLAETYGVVDVLVNNAAVMERSRLADGDVDSIKEAMEANFYGPMRMNSRLLKLLFKSEDARIINVSSGMGAYDSLLGGYAGYRLSKAGINAQTKLLANELAETSVKVNAVCPGWVKTDMGGPGANRPLNKGAETIVWLATEPEIGSGDFYRDKNVIPW